MKRFALNAVMVSLALTIIPSITKAGVYRAPGSIYVDVVDGDNTTGMVGWATSDKSTNAAYMTLLGGSEAPNGTVYIKYVTSDHSYATTSADLGITSANKTFNVYAEIITQSGGGWGVRAGTDLTALSVGSDDPTYSQFNFVPSQTNVDANSDMEYMTDLDGVTTLTKDGMRRAKIKIGTATADENGIVKVYFDAAPQSLDASGRTVMGGFSFIEAEVPEPATMALLAAGGIALLRRKRRKA